MASSDENIPSSVKEARKNDDIVSDLDDDDDDLRAKIFPQRLMEILSDERNHDAITWLPHGRAFIIRSRKHFADKVMPKFFSRKSKYSSFTRKLNRWNFVRISSGPELGAYYHEFFLRDKPHLAAQMFCKNARAKLAMTAVAEAPVSHQETPALDTALAPSSQAQAAQRMSNPLNALALRQMIFEEQLAKLQMLEQLSLRQQQAEQLGLQQGGSANRLLLEAMAAGGAGSAIGRSPQILQAQLALQQSRSQAARMMQLHDMMALRRQKQGDSATRSPINHRASAA